MSHQLAGDHQLGCSIVLGSAHARVDWCVDSHCLRRLSIMVRELSAGEEEVEDAFLRLPWRVGEERKKVEQSFFPCVRACVQSKANASGPERQQRNAVQQQSQKRVTSTQGTI